MLGCLLLLSLFHVIFLFVLVGDSRNLTSYILQDFPLFWPEDESIYDDMITVQRLSGISSSLDNLKTDFDQAQIKH